MATLESITMDFLCVHFPSVSKALTFVIREYSICRGDFSLILFLGRFPVSMFSLRRCSTPFSLCGGCGCYSALLMVVYFPYCRKAVDLSYLTWPYMGRCSVPPPQTQGECDLRGGDGTMGCGRKGEGGLSLHPIVTQHLLHYKVQTIHHV